MSRNGTSHTNGHPLTNGHNLINGHSHTNGNPPTNEQNICYYGYCGGVFDLVPDFREHEETHNFDTHGNIITFHCTFDGCRDTFNDAKLWRAHEEGAHPGRFNTGIHWICGDNITGTNEPCNAWFTYQDQVDLVQHIMNHNEGRQALTHRDMGRLLQAYCYPGHYEGFWCKLCFKAYKFSDHSIYANLIRHDPFQNVRLDHIQEDYIQRPEATAQRLGVTQTIRRGVVIN